MNSFKGRILKDDENLTEFHFYHNFQYNKYNSIVLVYFEEDITSIKLFDFIPENIEAHLLYIFKLKNKEEGENENNLIKDEVKKEEGEENTSKEEGEKESTATIEEFEKKEKLIKDKFKNYNFKEITYEKNNKYQIYEMIKEDFMKGIYNFDFL